jgi:3,4-dihydroxy 2-butanone 4-phosphate synthase/GTP cyclohydrolase II
VLVRTGQTEGSVDLARLAGLRPCGVICEIMSEDGTMARMPELECYSEKHRLCLLSIADLIQYRLQTEQLVRCVGRKRIRLDTTGTLWDAAVYEVAVESRQAIALVKGDVGGSEPVLCRVHSGSLIADLFSSTLTEGGANLREAVRRIESEGRGVVLYLPSQRTLGEELSSWRGAGEVPRAADSVSSLSEIELQSRGQSRQILRKFGLGAQMLADLGVRKLRLLSNSERKIAGLTGYGLEVVERVPLGSGEQSHPGENKHDG